MYKPVTVKDIALVLQLSPSTVSRALRDSYEISPKTKKIVTDYAKAVNYKSNPNALSLKNKRSYSIGIVVPEMANSFFSQAIAGIESIAYEKGYHTIITQTHDSSERELVNVNHLANRSVDGLLISMSSGTLDYGFLKVLHQNGLPIVFFDRIIDEIETFKVTSNNFSASYFATQSLITAGCNKIAVLANAPHLSITNDRFAGYHKALSDNDIIYRPNLIKNCLKGGSDYQEVENAINELLLEPDKPDAIFITSDMVTISCIRALKRLNVKMDEYFIVGFSNSDVVDLLQPRLSYITQKAFPMGQIAMQMLLTIIESKHPLTDFKTKILDTEFYWITD